MSKNIDEIKSKIKKYSNSREYEKAFQLAKKSLDKAKSEGDIDLAIYLLHDIGILCGDMGDPKSAYEYTRDSYILCRLDKNYEYANKVFKINNMVVNLLKMGLVYDSLKLDTALIEELTINKGDDNPLTHRTKDQLKGILTEDIGIGKDDYEKSAHIFLGIKCIEKTSPTPEFSPDNTYIYRFYDGNRCVSQVEKSWIDSSGIAIKGSKSQMKIINVLETYTPIESAIIMMVPDEIEIGKILWADEETYEIWIKGEERYKIIVKDGIEEDEETYDKIEVLKDNELVCRISGMLTDWPKDLMEDPRSYPHCNTIFFEELEEIDMQIISGLPMYLFS